MTTALYRRYRPETFAEVIGQDHVTAPLRAALRSGQVNHAYLFSGPRGCGKTSSARILARVLNCVQNTEGHPTDTPCGVCSSCVELATGGPGSLDVVEIDAASHGGVDDARELRERATFAPVRDRFKVFILDEAHMVSNQGFNALLKIVEEPPPHVKFVFATTEPDKVIGTIRSRTHHYPFRLVPPDVLVPYLAHLCATEGVPVGAGVLPLVVRAGAGSVRDSLSVLDQLIAGAGPAGLDYEGAVALLGYTPASLLDDLVDAVAARDGATVFTVVERVVATGHEPRRFVEDLLERLRDLIVIAAAGDAATAALGALPADQLERMRAQSVHLGGAELSRSADLANAALTEMAGATSPRLHLELLMARLLLPAADDADAGYAARLDRLERGGPAGLGAAATAGLTTGPGRAASTVSPVNAVPPASAVPSALMPPAPARRAPAAESVPAPEPEPVPAPGQVPARVDEVGVGSAPTEVAPADLPTAVLATSGAGRAVPTSPVDAPDPGITVPEPEGDAPGAGSDVPASPVAAAAVAAASASDTEMLRRRWPEVLETVKGLRRTTWILVGQNAQVHQLDASTLRLAFTTQGLVDRFRDHSDVVARAVHETLGFDVRVEGCVLRAGEAEAGSSGSSGMVSAQAAAASWQTAAPAGPDAAHGSAPTASSGRTARTAPPAARTGDDGAPPLDDAEPPPVGDEPPWDPEPSARSGPSSRASSSGPGRTASGPAGPSSRPSRAQATMSSGQGRRPVAPTRSSEPEPDEPSPDDPEVGSSGLMGAPLVAQLLGGTVIDEQVDELS